MAKKLTHVAFAQKLRNTKLQILTNHFAIRVPFIKLHLAHSLELQVRTHRAMLSDRVLAFCTRYAFPYVRT